MSEGLRESDSQVTLGIRAVQLSEDEQPIRHYRHQFSLSVARISPNRNSPRQQLNEQALTDLAESIKRWGQLQPVVVRQVDDQGSNVDS
jgi:hypothetical protein